MSTEKTMTVKILRETRKVSDEVKENLKQFNKDKKAILEALGQGEKTIAQLSEATGMSREKTMFLLMSLIKFGFASAGTVDDMDEYFTYKLKTNEQN
jgi:predicted Rossmann fold nucleotide-binding protein DprA/Smf involved in DNA uptake